MRNLLCLSALFFSMHLLAQNAGDYAPKSEPRKHFFGASLGINSPAGFPGLRVSTKVGSETLIDFGAGLGTWGYKAGANVIFRVRENTRLCPMVGLAAASGQNQRVVPLEVTDTSGVKSVRDVKATYDPAFLVNVGTQIQFMIKAKHRFFIEAGFSVRVAGGDFRIHEQYYKLTQASENLLNGFSPGGVMLGAGFQFGLK
jgi:hypothetical protein